MREICVLLTLGIAGAGISGWIALGATVPRQRLARSLTAEQIVRTVTDAPTGRQVSVPTATAKAWTADLWYAMADPATHNGALYLCVQPHRSQAGWEPPAVPALWRLIRAAGETGIPAWRQPLGAHDAYALGAIVAHKGKTWKSTIANNIWEPSVYGWTEQPKGTQP